ncbi:MAG: hypothetical protein MOIL_01518 [Candidatus Methanolliviera sp. GoM_oil]|nr:MAG: hypothetical protein MOIL_01518 [Candidatus Methanolliviera sp. GoM_oil]
MMAKIKRMFREEEAMTILGVCLGCLAGLPLCGCCLTSCVGGLMGLRMDMRYIPAILMRCTDYFISPMFY